jgi:ABC-type multidrug transport system ATPase subunit
MTAPPSDDTLSGTDELVIATHGLTKRYGTVTAVDGLDLVVRRGDRFGFLGPNGSGKTTTVRMLLGLVFATSGSIELLGEPVPRRAREVLPRIGALVEGPGAYGHLSARANLRLLDAAGPHDDDGGRRARRSRIDDALEQVGLAHVGRRPVRAFSLGMRQRLGLAAALVRRPQLLVLDEPTNGLDPRGIAEVRDLLVDLNRAGTTVFLSSHLLAEVELFCTRVAVLDRGRLVAQDDLDALRGPTGRVLVRVDDHAAPKARAALGSRVVAAEGGRLVLGEGTAAEAARALVAAGVDVHEVGPERRTLEQTVLGLTAPGEL